jgi:Vacuole effluxer Atg22 like
MVQRPPYRLDGQVVGVNMDKDDTLKFDSNDNRHEESGGLLTENDIRISGTDIDPDLVDVLTMTALETEYSIQAESRDVVGGVGRRPGFFPYIPKVMRWDSAPIEATGCAVDMYARATIFLSGIFVGPALLGLASNQAAASCLEDNDIGTETGTTYDECVEAARVYGFKPSSLLTNMGMVASLLSALSLPPTGAIVDYTYYRRHLGMYTAVALSIIKVIELTLSQSTWLMVALLQILAAFLYQIHTTVVYAYSSELSTDATGQSAYQTNFFIVMYISSEFSGPKDD